MKEVLDHIEAYLKSHNLRVERVDEFILQVKGDKEWRYIDTSFEESLRIGISSVSENLTETDNPLKIIEAFFKLISSEVEVIRHYKGKRNYKTEYYLINESNERHLFGTMLIWAFPFWKKSTKKIEKEEPLLLKSVLMTEMGEIEKNYLK